MVLLEKLIAVVPREETGGLASKTGKARDAEATEREGKRARFATTQISQSFDANFSEILFSSEQDSGAANAKGEGELKLHHGCDSCGQLVVLLLAGCAECDEDKNLCETCIRYNGKGRAIYKE